jgi:hypothetical protein
MSNESVSNERGQVTTRLPRDAAVRIAALFVLPYLLLMLAWGMSNPPGAAPDESDHLIKALGVGQLEIGAKLTGTAPRGVLPQRNASISRVFLIPAQLSPAGFSCTAFKPTTSAACQPQVPPAATGQVNASTAMGAYPPFLYLPAGLAAHLASTPTQAFLLGRLAFAAMCAMLLFVGAFTLVTWLGRWSLLGAFVALTPMAVFSSSVVSTSGVEICAAFAVASIVVVVSRRPGALHSRLMQALLGVSGAALVLSRQLGVVTLGVLLLVMTLRGGAAPLWRLLRAHTPAFILSLAALIAACAAVLWWELSYDHPSHTGSFFSTEAISSFDAHWLNLVRSAIGNFGWLDTQLPQFAVATWVVGVVVLCGSAVLMARTADLWTLLALVAACFVTAIVVYSTVFYPVQASLQGRHMLPMFMALPLLSGVVVVERLRDSSLRDVLPRLYLVTGAVVGTIQLTGFYDNARRYAVGMAGRLWFLGHARWRPWLGWPLWLVIAAAGAISLGLFASRSYRGVAASDLTQESHHTRPLQSQASET